MLTLFTLPKRFQGQIGVIQRNAIRSWTLLRPMCEIILFGDEDGKPEVADAFGLAHISEVKRNEFGTPLVDDLLEQAQRVARHDWLCFVNTDIILPTDFPKVVEQVRSTMSRFLMVGRRWDLDATAALEFGPDWEEQLRSRVARHGRLFPHWGSDYFVFPRYLWGEIPPFAIGRIAWDTWLIYRALQLKVPVVDTTGAVMAVHQNHDYGRLGTRADMVRGPEAERNRQLSRRAKQNSSYIFSLKDATHVLLPRGLRFKLRHPLRHVLWLGSKYWPIKQLLAAYMGIKTALGHSYGGRKKV